MTIRVIGAGYGRNGTLSLKHALEKLGFDKCYHMMELDQSKDEDLAWLKLHRGGQVDFEKLFEGYQASVDWPSCNFWREQMAAFPEARVILSERDPEAWYASIMKTIYPSSVALREHVKHAGEGVDPLLQRRSEMVFELVWDGLFDGRLEDKDHVISVYLAHNQQVKDEVPADKLLVFNSKLGWDPLCEFLEVPLPDEPYPKTNTSEDFAKMMEANRALLEDDA